MEHDAARNPRVGVAPAAPLDRAGVWLWPCVGLADSLLLRWSLFDFESGDYRFFLSRWYDLYVEQGRWRGLGLEEPLATYPPLYLDLLSVTVDYFGAWYVWRLARRHSVSYGTAWMAGAVVLFLPTVVMNGALWGQCDVMYTAGFLASMFYLLERKPVAALVAFGVSCALKRQGIFWCPLLAGRPLAVALWPGGLSVLFPPVSSSTSAAGCSDPRTILGPTRRAGVLSGIGTRSAIRRRA